MKRHKVIRITTVPISMNKILVGQLAYLNQFYEVVGVSSFVEKDFKEIQEREKVRMVSVPLVRRINLIKDIIALVAMYRVFKREKPLIIHSITPKAGLLSMLAGKMAGVPIRLHTFTGLVFPSRTGLNQKLLIFMDRLLCKCATSVYPEGKGVRNDLIKYGITQKPLKVIANGNVNGVDIQHYNSTLIDGNQKRYLKDKLGIEQNEFVFMFLGRIAKEKGIEELLQSFMQLSERYTNVKLLLVGTLETENGSISDESLRLIEQSSSIVFPGRTDDVRLYLSIANCFVLPSYREGFPNVLLQAGAMSVPVIATDINGCNEIIDPNKNGLLIKVKDTTDLYEKMKYMYEEEQVRIDFGKAIRKKVEQKFNNKLVWESLKQEYDYWVNLTVKNKNSSD